MFLGNNIYIYINISIKQSPPPQKRKPPPCCQAANISSNDVWRWMFRSVLQPSRRMTWTDATTMSFLELILHGHNGRECLSNQVYTFLYGRCRCPFRNWYDRFLSQPAFWYLQRIKLWRVQRFRFFNHDNTSTFSISLPRVQPMFLVLIVHQSSRAWSIHGWRTSSVAGRGSSDNTKKT